MFGHATAQLVVIKREERTVKPSRKSTRKDVSLQPVIPTLIPAIFEDEDEQLFETLRQLRKQLADQRAIPPYIVLSDKTLHLLASRQPRTLDAFGEISGIGEYKKKKYGKDFIEAIEAYKAENKR